MTATTAAGLAPALAAENAAEAVRELNHLTLWTGEGYAQPGDVDAVLAELALLAHRLPQALTQAARWLDQAHENRRIRHDGEDCLGGILASVAVVEAGEGLAEAAYRASRLAEALERVRQVTTRLAGGEAA